MGAEPILLDSITDARPAHAGLVAISGSHGGIYPATVAARAGLRGAVFNDAGRGLDDAGVAGVRALDEIGMAAVAADAASCFIGSAADAAASGVVSFANETASACGVAMGMTVAEAAQRLAGAPLPTGTPPPVEEARRTVRLGAIEAILLDSASLVMPEDAGAIIVAGSHGALIGDDPARALKADALFAAFNDAGFGKDDCGVSRLPALEARGVAAATVSAASARIGDAASALETGVVSALNERAGALGARVGDRLGDVLCRLDA